MHSEQTQSIHMASPTLIATKNGRKRKFTQYEWNLLGKNKEGWVPESDQTVVNTAESKIQPPPSGEKKGEMKTIPVDNAATKIVDPPIANNIPVDNALEETKAVDDAKKAEFNLAIEGFTKEMIKNFFDKKEVAYNKKANAGELKLKLAEYFKYELVEFQKEFSA